MSIYTQRIEENTVFSFLYVFYICLVCIACVCVPVCVCEQVYCMQLVGMMERHVSV